MQNLGGSQTDRDNYLNEVTVKGSRQYANLYFSGHPNGEEKGIPAEDLHNFVAGVLIAKDHAAGWQAQKLQDGKKITHIDFGTGPNLYNIIAGLPHVDEAIAVELAPANIEVLNGYKDSNQPFPDYWNAWLDLGAIAYDLGNSESFLALDKEVHIDGLEGKVNLYDALRKWPLYDNNTKALIRGKIYEESGINPNPENPYLNIQAEGLQTVLAQKLTVRQGDLFNPLGDDTVPSVADLRERAHFNTATYVTESNTRLLPQVLHAEVNKTSFSRPDGVWKSDHMSGTQGYGGFIIPEQLAENPDMEHEECPLSKGLLRKVMSEIVNQDSRYDALTADGEMSDDRKMVRPGKQYLQSVIVAGGMNHLDRLGQPKFNTGTEFMNHIRESVLSVKHVMNYDGPTETGIAVRDFHEAAEAFAERVGPLGNGSFGWDNLSPKFWDRYSALNFSSPIPGDIETMFDFIKNIRGKEGGTYIDVGTGSAPQFAVAAAAAGMGKIILSDYSGSAVDWLKEELLGEKDFSPRTEMWLDIAKLLSTFKDKSELSAYCRDNYFLQDLTLWQTLPSDQKTYWFNDRRARMEIGEGADPKDSFLDNRKNIQAKIHAMSEEGNFQVEKFSVLEPPEGLIGTADIVTENSTASCMTAKPSEYCQALLNVCRLAKPGTGIVNSSYTPYDNWKQYENDVGDLPTVSRHNYWHSAALSLILGKTGKFDQEAIARETSIVRRLTKKTAATVSLAGFDDPESLQIAGDNRFEHVMHIHGTPKDDLFKDGVKMLAQLQINIFEKAQGFLSAYPNSHGINIAPAFAKHLTRLEKELGMEPQAMECPDSPLERRRAMVTRIGGIIEHLKNNPRDVTAMDKADQAISDFTDNVYNRLIGRGHLHMVTQTSALELAATSGLRR
jgi:hypothetical protein